MIIEFELNQDDVMEAQRARAKALAAAEQSKPVRQPLRISAYVWAAIVFGLLLFGALNCKNVPTRPEAHPVGDPDAWGLFWLHLTIAMSATIGGAALLRHAFKRQNVYIMGPTKLETSETVLRAEGDGVRTEMDWSGFRGFSERPLVFLVWSPSAIYPPRIIPKRALGGERSVEAFRQLLRSHLPEIQDDPS